MAFFSLGFQRGGEVYHLSFIPLPPSGCMNSRTVSIVLVLLLAVQVSSLDLVSEATSMPEVTAFWRGPRAEGNQDADPLRLGTQNADPELASEELQTTRQNVAPLVVVAAVITVIDLVANVVSLYQANKAQETRPTAEITSFDIVDDLENGIQVGDFFYVEGTVEFYSGGEPNEDGDWSIEVSTNDGHTADKTGTIPGDNEANVDFSWRFQAKSEGTLTVTIEARMDGHYDDGVFSFVQEDTATDTNEKQREVGEPFAWNDFAPDPTRVFHFEKSTAVNEVQSLINGLSGTLRIDERTVDFNDKNLDEKERITHGKRDLVPHIFETTFSFYYGLNVFVDLEDGSRWSERQVVRKDVVCNLDPFNLIDSVSKLSRIEWGDAEFSPLRPVEGQPVDFVFNIPDPAAVPVPPEELTYDWEFGDGNTDSGVSVNHTYTDEDRFLVRVTALHLGDPYMVEEVYVGVKNAAPSITDLTVPGSSQVGEVVQFASGHTDMGSLDVVQHTWYFEDGTNATGLNVSRTVDTYGHFAFSLVVDDGDGDFDIAFGDLHVTGQPPTASTGGPYTVTESLPLTVDGTGSADPDGQVSQWIWDFGDGKLGYGSKTAHTFMHDGTYSVLLTVVDDNGLVDTDTTTVTVLDIGPKIVEVDVIYDDAFNVTIVGSGTSREPGITLGYAWDLGDGTQVTGGPIVTHYYQSPGTYTVDLTVSDGEGNEVTATETVLISEPPPSAGALEQALESLKGEISQTRNLLYIFIGVISALAVALAVVGYFAYLIAKKARAPKE